MYISNCIRIKLNGNPQPSSLMKGILGLISIVLELHRIWTTGLPKSLTSLEYE